MSRSGRDDESKVDGIELGLFASRIEAVCDEMGAVLRRAALSPNIRDRLDFSCAVFDAQGRLAAQAAHIPVHLGSMAYAMGDIVNRMRWKAGDTVVLNDPFLGGTHLPDVTVISPVYAEGRRIGFVVNRAHHANIGAAAPGSMPLSRSLDEEGLVLAPTHLVSAGSWNEALLARIDEATGGRVRGDFAAQVSANRLGAGRLAELALSDGLEAFTRRSRALNDYAERLATAALANIPDGRYAFRDVMDDDGYGHHDLPIHVEIKVSSGRVALDFEGTAEQVEGNINCPLPVTAAAVFYVFRCLMPAQMPACHGAFKSLRLRAPKGCLLNARRPAAVAAGNVETSSRVVDVVTGALAQAIPERIPAASHGSMNNLAMGSSGPQRWDYYETMGGGMGAGPKGGGLDAVQTHMTNTRNTPVEVLEGSYPLRVERYAIRRGSGGAGRVPGGDGLIREIAFLAPAQVTLLTERRRHAPWGLSGGASGMPGENRLDGRALPAKCQVEVRAGQRLSLASAGGGGWGEPQG